MKILAGVRERETARRLFTLNDYANFLRASAAYLSTRAQRAYSLRWAFLYTKESFRENAESRVLIAPVLDEFLDSSETRPYERTSFCIHIYIGTHCTQPTRLVPSFGWNWVARGCFREAFDHAFRIARGPRCVFAFATQRGTATLNFSNGMPTPHRALPSRSTWDVIFNPTAAMQFFSVGRSLFLFRVESAGNSERYQPNASRFEVTLVVHRRRVSRTNK